MFVKRKHQQRFTLLFILLVFILTACSLPTPTPDPCSADYLIMEINFANATPATSDAITLAAGCVYELYAIDNATDGNNGLPSIISPIIIDGNSAIISRKNDPSITLRFFHVAPQGNLILKSLTLRNGMVLDPDKGGAIHNRGSLTVIHSLIEGNVAFEAGGIYNHFGSSSMVIEDSTIRDNRIISCVPGGAGLYNLGIATIRRSTISGNGFPQGCDGMFTAGVVEITNSTFSGNAAGGIDNEGDLEIRHSTFAFNGMAGIFSVSGSVLVQNSLFTNNNGNSCSGGAIIVQGINMDTDGSCGGAIMVNPNSLNLPPLADNGGPTQTHALLLGSPAIDMTTRFCLPTDQRGELRPFGPECDLGAYEFTGSDPSPPPSAGDTVIPTVTAAGDPTLIPPTATFTPFIPTWTPTFTSVPPTWTPTFTPVSSTATATTEALGMISGEVWKDSNADGVRQGSEQSYPGVTIRLGQGACPSSGYMSAISAGDGSYSFLNVPAGTYCLFADVTLTCTTYSVATTPNNLTLDFTTGIEGSGWVIPFGFAPYVC